MSGAIFDLEAVQRLYDQGYFVQALELGQRALPLRDWPGTEGLVLAGRVAHLTGARRLGEALHARAWRSDPQHPVALRFRAIDLLHRRGPLAAWDLLEACPARLDGDAVHEANLLALRAEILGRFRDFGRAEAELARALELAPANPWLAVERSILLELADAYQEALAASAEALELAPGNASALQQRAHLLVLLDRDEEAAQLLLEALEQCQHPGVALHLVLILRELERWGQAWEILDRLEQLVPLAEKPLRQWLAAQRSDLSYLRGDAQASIEYARLVETRFHRHVARGFERSPRAARRVLPVRFVRQHHMTCGPATLTALGRYFQRPTDHLELAEEICCGGTTSYSERRWALENGFEAREFTVTERNARALIDRSLPFAVSTVEATNGHMQAIVGYDATRATLFLRDPYQPQLREVLGQEFLEHYRAFGPRGLLILPAQRRAELAGLELDDAELHDLYYRIEDELRAHRWEPAQLVYQELRERASGHRLALQARPALSAYEQDKLGMLSAVELLLEVQPGNERLLQSRLGLLGGLGRQAERLELLERLVERPDADASFLFELAREQAQDARAHSRARKLVLQALQRSPLSAPCFWLLARLDWDAGERERALLLSRFAACLEETNEGLAQAYFGLCHNAGRSAEALDLLRQRFERFARRSSLPARSLYSALEHLERHAEGRDVLDRALAARPEDGELLLFAAAARGKRGRIEEARALLAGARGRVREPERLAAEARLALHEGDLRRALVSWRAVRELEPLSVAAWQEIFTLLGACEGRERALSELRELAAALPLHVELQRLCIQGLGPAHPAEAAGLLEGLLERHPADAWAWRELALRRLDLGQTERALAAAQSVCQLEPGHPSNHALRGLVLERAGEPQAALAALRQALELEIDLAALGLFVDLSWRLGQGVEALTTLRAELCERSKNGDGVLAWWKAAGPRLDPEQLLGDVRELHSRRGDLWATHAVLVRQLLAMKRVEPALEVAQAACARFPLVAELWLDLASVHGARADQAEEQRALERALASDPRSSTVLRQLSLLHEKRGELELACALLERAIAAAPLEVLNHCWLADTLVKRGQPADALERVEHALRIDPHDHGAWQLHAGCARAAGRPERTLELLRQATRERPGDARAWQLLARLLAVLRPEAADAVEESLAAARRALELEPSGEDHLDLLAELLVQQGRAAEALQALEQAAGQRQPSVPLRGRRAWVLGESGRRDEAIALFTELVGLAPDYLWGWQRLLEYPNT